MMIVTNLSLAFSIQLSAIKCIFNLSYYYYFGPQCLEINNENIRICDNKDEL